MADYFTHFSCLLEVGTPANAAHALELYNALSEDGASEEPPSEGFLLSIQPEHGGTALWMRDDVSGDPERVIQFVKRCAATFALTGRWGFQYAQTCSKARLDGFGGGAQAHLASTDITLVPHPATWQDFVAARGDWHFDRVAVALDSAGDRVAVQGSLPKWIANAWTQETDLGVSSHTFGDGACLACLYMPAGRTKDAHVLVAEELGMPEAEQEIKVLLQTGTPVDEAFVRRVATALEVPFEPLAPFVGRPVASFHQAAICGGLVMKLSGGKAKVRAVVPMSFQSALAGIMLAAEVVKVTVGAPRSPTTSTRIDLLRPLAPFLHDPKSRDISGRCICADPHFLEAYSAKYDVSDRSL